MPDIKVIIGVVAIVVLIPLAVFGCMHDRDQALNHQEVVVATVVGKDRRCETEQTRHTRDDGSTYYTTDTECTDYIHTNAETFKNTPVMWTGKGPGDVIRLQGMMQPGRTYTFTVYGKSNPRWRQFRTVISAAPAE